MKILIDQVKVQRRRRLSNIASIGGLFMLLASVVLPLIRPVYAAYSTVLMVLGLAIAMLGIYFANRWVKKPRPEDRLDNALKSLGDFHRLYHYPKLPCDHVLLTPWGVLVLETINLEGEFHYKDGHWKEKMGFGRALRYIVEEHLGNPVKSALASESYLKSRLNEEAPDGRGEIPVHSVVVFVHPAALLDVESSETPVCKVDKLRRYVNIKAGKLSVDLYDHARKFLDEAI
jgi:Nuclease-related domain